MVLCALVGLNYTHIITYTPMPTLLAQQQPIVAFDGVLSSDIIIINIVVVIIIIAHDNDKNLIKTLPCRLSG